MIRHLARRVFSWRSLLRLLLLVVVVVLGTSSWLAGTETGARFVVGWVSGLTPGFSMRYASGTLLGPLRLRTITVKKATRIDIDDATLDWSLPSLLLGRLDLADMHVARAQLTLPASTPPNTAPDNAAGKPLPAVQAPLAMHVDHLAIDEFVVARGEHETRYTQVALGMDWKGDRMAIDHLVVGMPQWQADATGTLTTAGDWPLDATLRFVTPRSGAPAFILAGRAQGSLADAALELDSTGILASHVSGHVSPLAHGMPFRATLRAAEMYVPPRGAPQRAARLAGIAVDARGELAGAMTFDGGTQVETPWTKPLAARLHAEGTWRGLERAELSFGDPRFRATLVTDWRWLDGQHIHGHLDVRQLDLALVHPVLASRLAGGVDISGDIPPAGAGEPRFAFTADTLAGTLFARPVTIRGPLRWQDAHWVFDDLDLRQGDNRAVLRGTLAAAWNVDATLALGDLGTLLPALQGAATGSTHIAGAPADPHFLFALDAHALTLPAIRLPAPVAYPLQVPTADWHAAGEATLRDARFADAHTTSGDFAIAAGGTLDWQQGLVWNIDSHIGQFPLARFAPDLFFPHSGGRVSGAFSTRGALRGTLESLAIDTRLAGTFDEQPLAASAAFDWTPARTTLQELHLAHGANHLDASGDIDAAHAALKLTADAPALENSLRDLAGRVQASVRVDGPRLAPDADVDLTAAQLRWRDYALARLDGALHLVDGATRNSQLHLRADGFAAGNAAPGAPRVDSLELEADGTRNDHRLDLSLASGPLALALGVDGKFAAATAWNAVKAWNGTLARGSLDLHHWHWETVGEPSLAWHDDTPQAPTLTIAPHCWSDGAARTCLNAPAHVGANGDVSLEAFHLPLELLLADQLPLDTIVRGRIGGMLDVRWKDGTLLHLGSDVRNEEPLRITLAGDENEALRDIAQIDTLAAQAMLDQGAWHAEATLAGADAGRVQVRLAATPSTATTGSATATAGDAATPLLLDGSLDITALRVALLEAFTYQVHHLGGQVDAKLALGGTRAAPRTSGTIALKDGQFAFTRLPLTIDDIDLDGTFDGSVLRLDGSFHTPESPERARVAGQFDLDPANWHGEASLTGNRLFVAMPPQYQFTIAPDLHLVARPGEFAVSGDIRVPAGRIEVKKLPVQSVNLSRDVLVVHAEQTPEEIRGIGLRQKVDVHLLLGNDIRFHAFNGEGLLTGDLRVRSTPELPLLVDGELHVKDGKYRALGQQLTLKNADVIFNGPVDQPLLDALAVRTIDDPAVREVGLKLSGSLRAPQTMLWSSPELPPQEALSWLTTGHALSTAPVDARGEATQTAIAMGMAQGSALLSQAGQEIGLRDVQVSSNGDGTASQVQVGTNVSDRVFVGYNRRVFTGESSVLLRLQLTRRLMLEALSGVESALDIFYTFEF